MTRRLGLDLLTFVPYPEGPEQPGDAARSLEDGLALLELAEELGYGTGWVRVRHFERYLASPMTFFAAASQRTRRLRLGTAVIGARYESPVRLAEDAATVDLLSGGRLDLGVSSGFAHLASVFDGVFGQAERDFREEAQERIARLREALSGAVLGVAESALMSVPVGAPLVQQPHAPGLADRLWYGAGTVASAVRAGEQGMHLQVSTLNTEETGLPFAEQQAVQIRAYREAFSAAHPGRTSRVTAGRIVLPLLDAADEEAHRPFIEGYLARMDDEGRPRTADRSIIAAPMRFSPLHVGSPERIVASLAADPALAEADALTVTLPAVGGVESHRRILRAVAERIAPQLGWTPGA
ncbi:LLM class flavin-dependent oxidoreductase [Rathayibacter sp. AY1D2]|uniref:LLM class flavin-dependent oxidoreductase n=1 Tax=unclassified Rathayibacter TaxID=2609250 RepID=UPI000CE8F64B|nr:MULTISPECIES: LLM class flavin-dependent oxidoreductase [unclassified Rathayibacter]PPF32344.1 LLM class flavin-dependent oxidoreductase [Rathayibacter sp. AY1A2]PPI05247.1 LLM class flavin-dependent oxidoreductase [Rathayibacter sp. AY1B8]PPI07807.1 LLM class flavin-dependent oxidoreductase [Rathayibacter sp. AY1D2]